MSAAFESQPEIDSKQQKYQELTDRFNDLKEILYRVLIEKNFLGEKLTELGRKQELSEMPWQDVTSQLVEQILSGRLEKKPAKQQQVEEDPAAVVVEKKKKRKVDTKAPKKPKNAFFLYCTENRAKLKEELGKDISMAEGTKILSERWGLLPEEEKKPYNDAYEVQKLAYDKEMVEYKALNGTVDAPKPEKKKKPKKESTSSLPTPKLPPMEANPFPQAPQSYNSYRPMSYPPPPMDYYGQTGFRPFNMAPFPYPTLRPMHRPQSLAPMIQPNPYEYDYMYRPRFPMLIDEHSRPFPQMMPPQGYSPEAFEGHYNGQQQHQFQNPNPPQNK